LLVAEMGAARRKTLGGPIEELFAKVVPSIRSRELFRLTQQGMAAFTEKFEG